MARQPFNDFVNAPAAGGPSTPRGGRGGYGGRGGGRGGGGRGGGGMGGQGGVKSFKTDYSAVPFDYTAVNQQRYTKMDGFNVAPFGGNTATPGTPYTAGGRGRGTGGRGGGGGGGGANYTPRGRGGRGGIGLSTPGPSHLAHASNQDSPAPSGYGTPITGLGFHKGALRTVPGSGVRTPMRTESTVGRGIGTGEVIWGGRGGAPIFVKAGELFKDGEVDIVTVDNGKLQVETVPLSDPSAPQMLDLRNDTEFEILSSHDRTRTTNKPTSRAAVAPVPGLASTAARHGLPEAVEVEEAMIIEQIDELLLASPEAELSPLKPTPSTDASDRPEASSAHIEVDGSPIPGPTLDAAPQPPFQSAATLYTSHLFTPLSGVPKSVSPPIEVDDSPIPGLYVDVAPHQPIFQSAATLYTSHLFAPLGGASSNKPISDDEEIVFRPRNYKQPKPISVAVPKAALAPPPSAAESFQPPAPPVRPAAKSAPTKAAKAPAAPALLAQAFVDPRTLEPVLQGQDQASTAKRAAKAKREARKEKRKRRNAKNKAKGAEKKLAGRRDDFGVEDDIEWGSDGPPKGLLRVEGLEEEEAMMVNMGSKQDLDMEILKDYLAGTLLSAKLEDDSESEGGEDEKMEGPSKDAKGKGRAVELAPKQGKAEEKLEKGKAREKKKMARDWEVPPAVLSAASADEDDDEGDWEDEDGDAGQDGQIMDVDVNSDGESASDEGEASDASSILGDLKAVMDAFDSVDSEDEERVVAGKNAWTSEDEGEWFIRNMEEALGGVPSSLSFGMGAKSRGKDKGKMALFKSIEDGVFEMDLPTEPVKKGKKKAQGIPEALEAQWEADRRKKASKKQDRELARLVAEIEGVKMSKKKGKGQSKAQQAALAHLIPASASQVADMFDIDSDDERAQHIRGVGKMRKMMNLPPAPGQGGIGEIEVLVERVREFVRDPGQTTMSLHPMEKEGRQRMHMLAECFGLTSKSKGAGKGRFTIFIKTSRTGQHVDESQLERLISASSYSGGHFYKALYSKYTTGPKTKMGDKTKKGPGDRGTSGRAKEGDLVGEGADKIGEGNMGHKLLSMMGWAEGGRIGRSDGGLTIPIVAIVKNTKSGLGA